MQSCLKVFSSDPNEFCHEELMAKDVGRGIVLQLEE